MVDEYYFTLRGFFTGSSIFKSFLSLPQVYSARIPKLPLLPQVYSPNDNISLIYTVTAFPTAYPLRFFWDIHKELIRPTSAIIASDIRSKSLDACSA